ncbi:MAG: ABC transporter permease [Desulfomonilaceae bacterium]|nr:ABC transporter permease [Desulfomonilaceae bacterium]
MRFFIDALYNALSLVLGFDPEVYLVVWTSLKVSGIATFLASFVGIPLGTLLALKQFRGKQAVLLILNTLMALPTVVVGLFFYALLTRQGPLGDLGLLFTPEGIALGLFVLALPIVVNLTLAAVQGMDPRVFVTCKLLGATPAQQAWMIMREARFAVMAAVVMAFGRVISEVGIAMMLGGNIKGFTRTMTTAIALETSKGEFELGLALGILLMAVAFVVNALLFFIQRSRG